MLTIEICILHVNMRVNIFLPRTIYIEWECSTWDFISYQSNRFNTKISFSTIKRLLLQGLMMLCGNNIYRSVRINIESMSDTVENQII